MCETGGICMLMVSSAKHPLHSMTRMNDYIMMDRIFNVSISIFHLFYLCGVVFCGSALKDQKTRKHFSMSQNLMIRTCVIFVSSFIISTPKCQMLPCLFSDAKLNFHIMISRYQMLQSDACRIL